MTRRFRGESVHKVDQKGRVSVPAAFRRVLEEGDPDWTEGLAPNLVLIYGMPSGNCIEGYTVDGANRLDDKVARLPTFSRERRALERLLSTKSVYAQVDENGRIVLPQRLREEFGLETEAYFAGMGAALPDLVARGLPRRHGEPRRLARRPRRGRGSLRGPRRDGPRGPIMMMAPVGPHLPVLLGPLHRGRRPGDRRLARRHLRRRRLLPRPPRRRRRPRHRHRPRPRGARPRRRLGRRRAPARPPRRHLRQPRPHRRRGRPCRHSTASSSTSASPRCSSTRPPAASPSRRTARSTCG